MSSIEVSTRDALLYGAGRRAGNPFPNVFHEQFAAALLFVDNVSSNANYFGKNRSVTILFLTLKFRQ